MLITRAELKAERQHRNTYQHTSAIREHHARTLIDMPVCAQSKQDIRENPARADTDQRSESKTTSDVPTDDNRLIFFGRATR
jgi:hypothetical protein